MMILLSLIAVFNSCLSRRQYNSLLLFKSTTGKTFALAKVIDNHGIPLFGVLIQGSNLNNKIQTDRDGRHLLELTDNSKEIKAYWPGTNRFTQKH